ncbi:hypothetical protein T492DRAFT_455860 [Pavlovales sp. CCMP2436]|nr:hypothetical protein T492DRAFT_455860 [Pavlovales sp. CCMP2436]
MDCQLILHPDANEDVVERSSTAEHEQSSRAATKRLAKLSHLLERELGCEPLTANSQLPLAAFALVGAGHRLRGCVVAEQVSGAWELEVALEKAHGTPSGAQGGPPLLNADSPTLPGETSPPSLKSRALLPEGAANARDGSMRCSSIRVPAHCDIRYVWVDRSRRRVGLAHTLVEAARAHVVPGTCVAREHVAFSQRPRTGTRSPDGTPARSASRSMCRRGLSSGRSAHKILFRACVIN